MKLIVGLGNIGDKYCFTRHNAGFMAVDKIVLEKGTSFKEEKKFKGYIAKYKFNNDDYIVLKPTTYMNLSGEAVQAIIHYYKIDIKDVIVIYDDLSLDLGKMRFRANGSDGGHNGIKSVIQLLGTKNIARLKIGIGPQPQLPSEAFVLQNFTSEQLEILKPVIKKTVEAIDYFFEYGIQKAQNIYN